MRIEKDKILWGRKIIGIVIIAMLFIGAFTVFTVRSTEVTNNDAPADYVKASDSYVLVMNFTITTESDTLLNGTAPSDGQILEDSNQSDDWGTEGATQMLFYDATEDNEEWNSGEDCIFLDDGTADNEYTTGDSVLAGTAPVSGTICTGFGCKNQTAWKRIKSYDAANGGAWNNATDAVIFEGTDNNTCYMDELNAVTLNLSDTCNASGTDISDVTIWVETTGAGFSSTDDTFIGNGTFDGTNSTVISGLSQDINTSVTLYIAVNISGSATNGATIIMEIPSLYDVNSNGAYDAGDQGLFLAGTNDTGGFINAYAQTIDTSVPTVVIEYSTSVIYLKDVDSVRIFANFSEGGAGITESPQISINYSGGTDLDATNMAQTDNLHWYYDLNIPTGSSYDGQFTVNVSATDNASNALNPDPTMDNSKYVDNSAPIVTITVPQNNSYYNSLATINGTASDSGSGIGTVNLTIYNQTSDKYWNGTDWDTGLNWSSATGYTSWTYDSTDVTWFNGSYYYVNVTSTDNVSNVGIAVLSNFTIDTSAPTVVIEFSSSVNYFKNGDVLRVFANFTEGGSGIDESSVKVSVVNVSDSSVLNNSEVMSKTSNTEWYFDWYVPSSQDCQVNISIDALDNMSFSLSGINWSTSKYIDNSAPIVTIYIPQNNSYYNSLATINGTASDSGSGIGTVNLTIYNQTSDKYWNGTDWDTGLNWSSATGYTSWTYDSTDVTWFNGSYYYVNVTSTDNVSNVGIAVLSNFTFDTYAPEISSISAGSITSSSATITWTTNENGTSFVEYGTTTSYGSWSNSSTYTTSHSRDLTGLSQNTQYHYRVKSVDVASNSNTSTDKTFTTEMQYTPPSGPSNYAPTVDAGGPYSGFANVAVTFTGSGYDSDGTIVGYRWDWTNDGTYDTDWLTSNTTSHTYSSAGTYTIKLQVKDDDELTSADTAVVTINESTVQLYPPLAKTNGPYSALTFENIVFDGTGSTDTDGTITNYTWNLGDGTTAYGATVTHSYNTSGLFYLTLTVKDNDGLTNTSTTTANITLDSDADGWSDELEESYGLNATNPNSNPTDTDGDGIPDEDSPDGKYIGDNDDDNDGIDDETEIDLGSNPNDAFDVKTITIEETSYYLIDTNGDGNLDKFYDSNTQKNTVLKFEDGKYLIDTNGDGKYNYIYDPVSGEVKEYSEEEPQGEFPWLILIIIAIVLIIILIIAMLFKTGYLYLEDEHTEEEKTSKKHKKTNNKSGHSKK